MIPAQAAPQGSVPRASDPLIEEVRRIRKAICEPFDHDVDRLCDHLAEVEREYWARRGVFAGLSPEAADRVVASWGESAHRRDDPMIDEIRSLRK